MVVPPPPSPIRPGELEPEMASDARQDAALHEGAADALLALVAPVLEATEWRTGADGQDYSAAVIDERDSALLRTHMAQAEATLALGFRLGQIAAVLERATDALERAADAAAADADDEYDSRAPRG